ncbi:MAG: hypothetical protein WCA27_26810 [Candidatus Sulfotelmatobacter sp.]
MADKKDDKPRVMPKGGRKGGTTFPRMGLTEALTYSDNVAKKTTTGPQSVENIRLGVFENKGPRGGVKAAALKQYGLLEEKNDTYDSTALARKILAAIDEEKPLLWRQAFLTSKIFAQMYETYQGDLTTRPKLRSVAITKGVHSDNSDECVEHFVSSALKCGLAAEERSDGVQLVAKNASEPAPCPGEDGETGDVNGGAAIDPLAAPPPPAATPDPKVVSRAKADDMSPEGPPARGKVQVNLNLHVDSSTDPETLRRQLEYLEKFGVI